MAAVPASAVIHIIFTVPCIVVDNAMASRVYPVVALRYIKEFPDTRSPVVFTTAIYSCDKDNSTTSDEKFCGWARKLRAKSAGLMHAILDNVMASRVFRVVAIRYIREAPNTRSPVVFTTVIYSCDKDYLTELGRKASR